VLYHCELPGQLSYIHIYIHIYIHSWQDSKSAILFYIPLGKGVLDKAGRGTREPRVVETGIFVDILTQQNTLLSKSLSNKRNTRG
jgi:hypothetical protein